MFFGFPVNQVKQVIKAIQLIQVMQDNQDNQDNRDNQDNQVMLAHLWVDFQVIFSFLEHVFCWYPALCFRYDTDLCF